MKRSTLRFILVFLGVSMFTPGVFILAGESRHLLGKDEQLISGAAQGKLDQVKKAIGANANLNVKDRFADTALIKAFDQGHVDIVEELIKAGADINTKPGKNLFDEVSSEAYIGRHGQRKSDEMRKRLDEPYMRAMHGLQQYKLPKEVRGTIFEYYSGRPGYAIKSRVMGKNKRKRKAEEPAEISDDSDMEF